MKLAELLLLVSFILALVLKALNVEGGDLALLIALTFLSLLYYLLGFVLFNGIRLRKAANKNSYVGISARRITYAIAVGWSLSTILIGILFRLLYLPGSEVMLITGIVSSAVVLSLAAFFFDTSKMSFCKRSFSRLIPFTILAIVAISISNNSLIDFFERHDAEGAQELKEMLQNDSLNDSIQ